MINTHSHTMQAILDTDKVTIDKIYWRIILPRKKKDTKLQWTQAFYSLIFNEINWMLREWAGEMIKMISNSHLIEMINLREFYVQYS